MIEKFTLRSDEGQKLDVILDILDGIIDSDADVLTVNEDLIRLCEDLMDVVIKYKEIKNIVETRI
jgi:hypothetical protein